MFTFPICHFAGGKEFPKWESSTSGNQAGGTSHSITLPTGIQSGDYIIIMFTGYIDIPTTTSTPSGFTKLYTTPSVANLRFMECFYKVANGTEGGTTVTVSTSANAFTTYAAARISGASDISGSVTSASGSSYPNPPNHSPSWGSDKNLWLAMMAHSSFTLLQSPPSEYSSNAGQNAVSSGGIDYVRLAWGTRDLTASSENPNTFSRAPTGSIAAWIAATVSFKPK